MKTLTRPVKSNKSNPTSTKTTHSKLPAILGGTPCVGKVSKEMFTWPVVTKEDENAVLKVLRAGNMSGTDVTREFEQKFAAWQGSKFALGYNNGTASLHGAMFGVGLGVGDEMICPSVTYWASALPCLSLGASPVFAEVDPVTLCLDPNDIEHRITPKTKAILVVHYFAHPADMDSILKIARKHNLKVIEDVSHAQGGLYKGQRLGTIGDVAGMSMMAGKSFAIGEAGMLTTNNRDIYERAITLGHYERCNAKEISNPELQQWAGLPLGGYKYRMHQLSSAMGLVQLKHYDKRCAEIRKSINYFWDLLKGVPGIRPHSVDEKSKSNMAGWYGCCGHYLPEELGGLSITRYCDAVRAESASGMDVFPRINNPLHLHPILINADIYGHGKPTRSAHSDRNLAQPRGSLPLSEKLGQRVFSIPWFKKFQPKVIQQFAEAFRKASLNAAELRKDDQGNPPQIGSWNFFRHRPTK